MVDDLIKASPYIAGWTVAVILAAIMVRRGGSKAEKLFLTGSGLMLVVHLASPLLMNVWQALVREHVMTISSAWVVSLPLGILTMAGLICLLWAFWLRFWKASPMSIQPAKEESV